jgi:hypothetical protein
LVVFIARPSISESLSSPVNLFLFCFVSGFIRPGTGCLVNGEIKRDQSGIRWRGLPGSKTARDFSGSRHVALVTSMRLEWNGHGTKRFMGWFLAA